jgi:osmotically-inducible protein OsmY
VVNTLAWDAAVPLDAVKATVTNGWVTLNGTFRRSAAIDAARVSPE